MQVGTLNTPNAGVQVVRNGQTFDIDQGGGFSWGDLIRNNSATPMEIKLPPLAAGQGNGLLIIQPGASARLDALHHAGRLPQAGRHRGGRCGAPGRDRTRVGLPMGERAAAPCCVAGRSRPSGYTTRRAGPVRAGR